jgi:predicted MFS family arabinose efflux permease
MVGEQEMPNAVSLNSATFNMGRVIGPAVAGLLISGIGTGWVFLVNAVSFLAVITGLRMMRKQELRSTTKSTRTKGQLREGLAYVRQRDELLVPIVLIGLIGMVGLNFPVTIALMAKVTFHRGADSFGLLGTSIAVGSLIGALLAAQRSGRGVRPRQRTYLFSGFLFGVFETISGLMPSYWTFAALLVPTGITVILFANAANTTVQMAAGPQFRGRVMGLYVLVFVGGTPIGAPLVGLLAEHFGPRSSLTIGGAASAFSAVLCALYLRRRNLAGPKTPGSVTMPEVVVPSEAIG